MTSAGERDPVDGGSRNAGDWQLLVAIGADVSRGAGGRVSAKDLESRDVTHWRFLVEMEGRAKRPEDSSPETQ